MSPCPNHLTTRKAIAKSLASLSASSSRRLGGCKRFASSSTSAAKSKNEAPVSRTEPLTLLHKMRKILPRIIGKGGPGFQRTAEASNIWDSILSEAHEDLSATGERPAKVIGAHECGSGVNSPSSFKLSSGYLTQFPVPVVISELRPPQTFPSTSSSTQPKESLRRILENPTFLESDIRIIVCNPITTPIEAILDAQVPTNTILVLTSNIPQTDLDAIIQQRSPRSHSSYSRTQSRGILVVSADPGRAIHAVSILQANPSSSSAIQKYSTDFVGSRLSRVTKALHDKLAPAHNLKTVQRKLGLERLQEVLDCSSASIRQTRNELDKAFIDQTALKEALEEHRARVEGDVLGGSGSQSDKNVPLNAVTEAIKQAERDMRPVMDRLTWWRMIWRVDEISSIVATATARTWCCNLEKKLILETGRLSVLQNETSKLAFSLLSNHPTVSTAILRNSLLQIKRSPGYHLTADSLIQPIFSRRNQIIEYPTMRLHVTGQRAVLGMTGGIVGGAGIGWAGWLGWLLGSGEGLLGFIGMDAGTAMGLGMLSAVASIRWAVGRWEKSKKRWWQDWVRVGEGLDRDLKVYSSALHFSFP
ncbi:hypothetical protein CVT25_014492 [Psilocybe cyanescens]|uniref:Uncharacterized protein n=1 Tax=Psilocybe cyanescens TaxID=93625 RepID=A0A409VP25_PSICY|nr:hypothetical protein CVT25_014492 [Psilocybe cyanescens]